jgi:hypothetical protein
MFSSILKFLSGLLGSVDKIADIWRTGEIRKQQELVDALRSKYEECEAEKAAKIKEITRQYDIEIMKLKDEIELLKEESNSQPKIGGRVIEG